MYWQDTLDEEKLHGLCDVHGWLAVDEPEIVCDLQTVISNSIFGSIICKFKLVQAIEIDELVIESEIYWAATICFAPSCDTSHQFGFIFIFYFLREQPEIT